MKIFLGIEKWKGIYIFVDDKGIEIWKEKICHLAFYKIFCHRPSKRGPFKRGKKFLNFLKEIEKEVIKKNEKEVIKK
jgi:hypothetical protein